MKKSLKQRLQQGDVVIGGTLTHFLRPAMIRLYSKLGFDFVYIENEHSMNAPDILSDCILSANDNNLPVIIKPPYFDRGETARLLDAGVAGVQLPQTETRDQIDEFGSWVKYPPVGTRMVCCASGLNNFGSLTKDDLARINEETIVIAHIETQKGLENVRQIAQSPFVDIVFIGQMDLSVSMGRPYEFDCPEMLQAIEKIVAETLKAGKIPGVFATSLAAAKPSLDAGARFIESADEISFIVSGTNTLLGEFKQEFSKIRNRK